MRSSSGAQHASNALHSKLDTAAALQADYPGATPMPTMRRAVELGEARRWFGLAAQGHPFGGARPGSTASKRVFAGVRLPSNVPPSIGDNIVFRGLLAINAASLWSLGPPSPTRDSRLSPEVPATSHGDATVHCVLSASIAGRKRPITPACAKAWLPPEPRSASAPPSSSVPASPRAPARGSF
jgi:hypothetical protein